MRILARPPMPVARQRPRPGCLLPANRSRRPKGRPDPRPEAGRGARGAEVTALRPQPYMGESYTPATIKLRTT